MFGNLPTTLLDIFFASLALRIILGFFFAYPGIGRFFLWLMVWGILTFLSFRINMPATSLFLTFTIAPILLILLANIIPELRRAYQAARIGRLFFHRATTNENLSALVSAVVEMADSRTGALLVFPDRDSLDSLVSGGEELQAKLNKSLLLSIVNPKAPRHDGAILIDNGQITRIGAVLPIASGDRAREGWGTRHLAALGLSEISDAHVLVVSEERGTVSHIHEGRVTVVSHVSEETVRPLVLESLDLAVDSEKAKSHHLKNVFLWVASIILAAAVSVGFQFTMRRAASGPTQVQAVDASIRLTNIPNGLTVEDFKVATCKVFIRMPQSSPATPSPLVVQIDLANARPGTLRIPLRADMVNLNNPNWHVEKFQPEEISLRIIRRIRRDATVKPVVRGLSSKLTYRVLSVSPATLACDVNKGAEPDDLVVPTLPINLSEVREPGRLSLSAELAFPAHVRPAGSDPSPKVSVDIEILPASPRPSGR